MFNEWFLLAFLVTCLFSVIRRLCAAAFPGAERLSLPMRLTVRIRLTFPQIKPQQYFVSPPPPREEMRSHACHTAGKHWRSLAMS